MEIPKYIQRNLKENNIIGFETKYEEYRDSLLKKVKEIQDNEI